jgi:PBP1b-binding outer membrane lipoprotein LpoB
MKHVAMISLLAVLLTGCSEKDDSIAMKAGEKLGQQVTDFTKGVGKGIDQKMMVQVSLSPQVLALGLTNTIAKSLGLGGTNGISVYFIASQNISNTLVVRALNGEDVEVGRARKLVVLQKDEATYITFNFEDLMDMQMVKRFAVGL